jgi:hypothetical protein
MEWHLKSVEVVLTDNDGRSSLVFRSKQNASLCGWRFCFDGLG